MTAVVGISHRGRVILGADSSINESDDGIYVAADPKVFKRGPVAIGFAGSFRGYDLLRHIAEIPTPHGSVSRWARCDLVPQLRKAAHEHDVSWSECQALIAYQGRLFFLESDWAVVEPAQIGPGRRKETYACIGSGSAWAQGCLYALHRESGLTLRQRAEEALRAAEANCGSVRGPFSFVEI